MVAVFIATMAATATAATTYSRFYVDELDMSNYLESTGVIYKARKIAVDNASCKGLRRFGVKESAYGLDKYWRFRCDANGANGHWYDVQLSTWTGPKPGYVYPRFLSVRRVY